MVGLIAAALFGASAPIAKLLLPGSGPLPLAALFYLGAGAALAIAPLVRRAAVAHEEARLGVKDMPLLAGIVITGGVMGPVLMLAGLQRLSAVTSSLLLNLEAPFTILLAISLFHEHLERRELVAVGLIVAGAGILSHRPGELHGDWIGTGAIAGACLCWAVDNNLTQRLSLRDPVSVVRFKTLAAGSITLVLALATGQPFAPPPQIGAALLVGSMSYGLSIVLHVHALRVLGAARQAAFFSSAPFAGAMLAILLLRERPGWTDGVGGTAMLLGVLALALARHGHLHTHQPVEHDHRHLHDEHHAHGHEGPFTEPHSHPHRHDPVTHEHPHVSDVHHRHPHR